MVDVDKRFLKELGGRIAARRKQLGLTQTEMAEEFGCSQQTFAAYEAGTRRLPISFAPKLAAVLELTLAELLGQDEKKPKRGKRGPPSKLELQVQQVMKLPRSKQKFVSEMIETVLAQAS